MIPMIDNRQELLDDEWLIVRHSGEIPEIAFCSVLYYLTEDEEGTCICLSEEEQNVLKNGAEKRYHEIVLRDIQPANRDKTIYRGVKRTIYNYYRFSMFCERRGAELDTFRTQVATVFLTFLHREVDDVASGERFCCLNVSYSQIVDFCVELEIAEDLLPEHLKSICPE